MISCRNDGGHLGGFWHRGPLGGAGLVAGGPFLPDGFVVEQLGEDTPDDWAGGEPDFPGVFSFIPICHRGSIRCLIEEGEDRVDQRFEIGAILGQGGCPGDPVELGVVLPVVEGKPVAVLNLAVVGHFLDGDLGRE